MSKKSRGKRAASRAGVKPAKRGKQLRRAAPNLRTPPPAGPLVAKASGGKASPAREAAIAPTRYAARTALRLEAKKSRKTRTQAYDQWLRKKPKVRRPLGVHAAPAAPKPRILAEGDSWFDYPWMADFDGGIVPHLARLADVAILNLAHYGDEVRAMLGVDQRKRLEEKLRSDKYDFQVLLMSGGGNDIAGEQFCLWLRDFEPGMTWIDALDPARLEKITGIVEMGYRDLIKLRDRLRPNCHIFTHAYDFPLATGKKVCGVGPWLKPSLDHRGWKDIDDQFRIVRQMMLSFDALLVKIEAEQRAAGRPFTHVRTQGVMNPATDWANELHPTSAGFRKLAVAFNNALAGVFPGAFKQV